METTLTPDVLDLTATAWSAVILGLVVLHLTLTRLAVDLLDELVSAAVRRLHRPTADVTDVTLPEVATPAADLVDSSL